MSSSAGSFYNFHIFDPFQTMTGFFQKSVPLSFPDHCKRFDDPSPLEVQLKLVTVIEVVPPVGQTMEDAYKKLQPNLLRYIQSLLHVRDKSVCYLRSYTTSGRP